MKSKDQLRKNMISELKTFTTFPEKKQAVEKQIVQELFASSLWNQATSVGITNSMAYEFDTLPIIAQAFQMGKKVATPKTFSQGAMDFYQISQREEWVETSFGVKEPKSQIQLLPNQIDLLIVPGVVFSTTGYRIGFGGGYYDRYLNRYQGATCSLVFPFQLKEGWEKDDFDQPVEKIITVK